MGSCLKSASVDYKHNAKSPALAVDGNSSTFARTTGTEYAFLAVDLGTAININFTVLNIHRGKLCNVNVFIDTTSDINSFKLMLVPRRNR